MKKLITYLFIFIACKTLAGSIQEAYKALSIYDYFKARQLFYRSLKKQPAAASYGLATIYYRNDNPFSNSDSAAKYILIASTSLRDTVTYANHHINSQTVYELADKINQVGLQKYVEVGTTASISHYLSHYLLASDSVKANMLSKER
ncbi:MAG: hypothetical protein LC122_04715 [Chitinophagales bacterium]|nr:hypothetical protein [Chitinophagales bacterium]